MSSITTTPGTGRATNPAPSSRKRRRSRVTAVIGRHPIGMLFVAPYVLFLVTIFAYPLVLAVWISFHDYFFAAPGVEVERPFVGLENYRTVLSDPDVQQSFVNVAEFLLINVPLTVVLSLVLAAGLNGAIRGRTFLRLAYFAPYVTASVALVAVWLFMFSQDGMVNELLGPLAPDPSWLVNSTLAMPVIALFVTWKQLGFFVLLYLAALQGVPKELYESAASDGAGRLGAFWHVTVPGVRSATTLVLILSTITGANLFTEPYLLTNGGGPNGASSSPVLVMYQKGIEQGNPDTAAAIGVVLVIGVLLISLVHKKLVERD